jgi:hypothetical protein
MPLKTLFIHDTDVTDLTPLRGMRLEYFTFSPGKIAKGVEIIRDMSSLLGIGTPDMEEPSAFWRRYDKGLPTQ